MAAAPGFAPLVAGRVIVGCGVGTASMSVPLYIAEASPPHLRGRLVTINNLFITGGQFFAAVLDSLLQRVPDGWRWMLGVAALPAAAQLLGFWLLLPESPRFMVLRGDVAGARATLRRMRGGSSRGVAREVREIARDAAARDASLGDALRSPAVARALLLGCGLQALQQLCGVNTVMYYSATILKLAGFGTAAAIWLSAATAFANFAFTLVGIALVERAGRRPLTLYSLLGVALSLAALGASFQYAASTSPAVAARPAAADVCAAFTTCYDCSLAPGCGYCAAAAGANASAGTCLPGANASAVPATCAGGADAWLFDVCPNAPAGYASLAALVLYLACFAPGMGPMPWTINAEIYPLQFRAPAVAAATATNWLCNFGVSFTFLKLTRALTKQGAFWAYACVAAVGGVGLYFTLPETRGVKIEDMGSLFAGGAASPAAGGGDAARAAAAAAAGQSAASPAEARLLRERLGEAAAGSGGEEEDDEDEDEDDRGDGVGESEAGGGRGPGPLDGEGRGIASRGAAVAAQQQLLVNSGGS
jgi:SP family myo-inositol transporter-like MFS transporter 13